jgi:hypothetical protein
MRDTLWNSPTLSNFVERIDRLWFFLTPLLVTLLVTIVIVLSATPCDKLHRNLAGAQFTSLVNISVREDIPTVHDVFHLKLHVSTRYAYFELSSDIAAEFWIKLVNYLLAYL